MTKQKVKFRKHYWVIYNPCLDCLVRKFYFTEIEALKQRYSSNDKIIKVQIRDVLGSDSDEVAELKAQLEKVCQEIKSRKFDNVESGIAYDVQETVKSRILEALKSLEEI